MVYTLSLQAVGRALVRRRCTYPPSPPARPGPCPPPRSLSLSHTMVHEQLIYFYRGFKSDAHPMAILCAAVGGLSSFYKSCENIRDPTMRLRSCMRMIAKAREKSSGCGVSCECRRLPPRGQPFPPSLSRPTLPAQPHISPTPTRSPLRPLQMPTLAAYAYKTHVGQPIVYPKNSLSYAERLLYMLFALPSEPYRVDPVCARALEKLLVLHLDHEQNASTTTVRSAGSSQANPFACVAAGVSSLWGPAHGGANEAVLKMLQDIGTPANIPAAVARAKDKADAFRLMGFGHRVYKRFDPRARVMKQVARELLDHLGIDNDPLLDVALELEAAVSRDEYFVTRSLYPNVDFYSGIVLRALKIPTSMFTVIFSIARSVGWVSQWREMASDPVPRIARPRQVRGWWWGGVGEGGEVGSRGRCVLVLLPSYLAVHVTTCVAHSRSDLHGPHGAAFCARSRPPGWVGRGRGRPPQARCRCG